MYIAIYLDRKIYYAETFRGLILQLPVKIKINDGGEIFIDGKKDSVTYNMQEWTMKEAFDNFCNTRLISFLKVKDYRIFKSQEL
jgi:hypothetical protein